MEATDHFNAKYSEIKPYPLCFGNISQDFAVNNMNKTELNVHVYDLPVEYNILDISDFIKIHKFLKKMHDIKQYFDLKIQ